MPSNKKKTQHKKTKTPAKKTSQASKMTNKKKAALGAAAVASLGGLALAYRKREALKEKTGKGFASLWARAFLNKK
jgi:hypothetical protein